VFYVRILNEFSIAITVSFTATHVIALNHVVAAGLTALLLYVPVVPQRWAAYTLIFSHRMQCVADSVRQIHNAAQLDRQPHGATHSKPFLYLGV